MRVELRSDVPAKLKIGQQAEFCWSDDVPGTQVRLFVVHQGVIYPDPVTDWLSRPTLRFFPEAPGRYVAIFRWRRPDGSDGREELPFEVSAGADLAAGPSRVTVPGDVSLWAPSEWEAGVVAAAEHAMLGVLSELVGPGDTVYDVGANLGLYAMRLARLVGSDGLVYCFEANPVCLAYLQANAALNGFDQIRILPVAALDRSSEAPFAIHYGNNFLGLTDASPFYRQKLGHVVKVRCEALDDLIAEHRLKPPRLVKMDIEGAEVAALRGMARTLESERPTLVIELHGAGNARGSLEQLDALGYRYLDPLGMRSFSSASETVEAFGDTVFQVVATCAAR